MTKVMKDLVGRKIRLLDGVREKVVKVTQRNGYETESGYVVPPDCLGPSGPGFKEIEPEGDASAKKPARKTRTQKEEKPTRTRRTRRNREEEEEEKPTRSSSRKRRRSSQKDEEKPARSRRSRRQAKEKDVEEKTTTRGGVRRKKENAEPRKRLKPVKKMNAELTDAIQQFFYDNVEDLIQQTGYAFQLALVGSKYTDDAISVEIGLLPTNATEEDKLAYREVYDQTWEQDGEEPADDEEEFEEDDDFSEFEDEDESDDGDEDEESDDEEDFESEEDEDGEDDDGEAEEEEVDADALIQMVLDDTKLTEKRVTKYVEDWLENADLMDEKFGDEVQIGMLMENEDGHSIYIVGYAADKKKVVVWDDEEEKAKAMTFGNIAKYEAVDPEEEEMDEEDGELSDEDWDDFEE